MHHIRLYIVRHGETEANKTGIMQSLSQGTLTPHGIEQAKKLALRLKDEPIDAIIASDLERVKQTVREIIAFHQIPVRYLPLLREWNVGEFELRKKEAYRAARTQSGLSKAKFRPRGGENYYDVAERAKSFLDLLRSEYDGQRVLVATHGDFIRVLISHLRNQALEDAVNIPQKNAALNMFDITPQEVKTIVINSTDHLQ